MTIAVIGAGAIGGVVAAYLTKAGCDVTLIAKSDQCAVINNKGLTIDGVRGKENFRLNVLPKLDKSYDLVIFSTKTQDLEAAYQWNNEFLESGLVLTTQNGVQADNILSCHYDKPKQMSSIVMFGATYVNPGEIMFNFDGDWILGRPFSLSDPTVHETAKILGKAFQVVVSPNIMGAKYLKLFVNFNNCIPALLGRSMQETFADMDMCRLSIQLLKEGLMIIKEAKIELEDMPNFAKERIIGLAQMPLEQAAGIIHKTLTGLSKEPLYGSILQSIMRGRASEIDFINGEVVQVAAHIKVPAPFNTKMLAMVHEVERSGKYFTLEQVKEAFNLKEISV